MFFVKISCVNKIPFYSCFLFIVLLAYLQIQLIQSTTMTRTNQTNKRGNIKTSSTFQYAVERDRKISPCISRNMCNVPERPISLMRLNTEEELYWTTLVNDVRYAMPVILTTASRLIKLFH